jgi:hypothetical protein
MRYRQVGGTKSMHLTAKEIIHLIDCTNHRIEYLQDDIASKKVYYDEADEIWALADILDKLEETLLEVNNE